MHTLAAAMRETLCVASFPVVTEEPIMGILIFLLLAGVAFGGGVLGWIQWRSARSLSQSPKWRSIAGLMSLAILSLQVLIFFLFEAYGFVIGSFSYRSRSFFLWGRIDFCLCVLALVAAVLAKGRFRISVALSAVAVEVIWFLLGTGL
jgi:fucose 4-O-acetylase-like acetyltransferase